jgi:hypothetical protein
VRLRFFLPVAAALATSAPALAEPTSWLSLGGGIGLERNGLAKSTDNGFALDGAIGVGSPATAPIVVGGVFRAVGYIGLGVDMNVSARLATRGYCVGDWGVAVDLGVGARLWGGGAYGSWPLHAALTGGLPFGFQVAVGADFWDVGLQTPQAAGGFVALELDLLRLTSMRSGNTTKVWANPAPANAPPAPEPPTP